MESADIADSKPAAVRHAGATPVGSTTGRRVDSLRSFAINEERRNIMIHTPLRITHIGFGNMICANSIECIVTPGSAAARRLIKRAKESNTFLDMTAGHAIKSLILLESGRLIGSAISPRTVAARIPVEADNPEYVAYVDAVLSPIYAANRAARTSELMFNTEMVPAEGLGVKNAAWDKESKKSD